MRKIIAAFLFLLCSAVPVFSEAIPRNLYTGTATSTSGGATITVNITAATGRKAVIWGVVGRSDLSTSVIQIQEANTSGTTVNYTTVARIAVGAQTTSYGFNHAPLYVGKVNYGYRFLLDTTTANSLVVTYSKE
jgi:hypothetical protein